MERPAVPWDRTRHCHTAEKCRGILGKPPLIKGKHNKVKIDVCFPSGQERLTSGAVKCWGHGCGKISQDGAVPPWLQIKLLI